VALVLQFSDTHLTSDGRGCYDRDPAARLRTVVDAWLASGRRADLVLLSGDIADDGSVGGCRAVANLLAKLGAPVFAIPGNHDLDETVRETFGAETDLEIDGWRLLGVDSAIPGEVEGAVDPAGLMAEVDGFDVRPTLVAMHHPPVSPSTHHWFRLAAGDEVVSGLAARPHVRAVVSGHLHQPFEVYRDGIALLGAPSTLYGIRHVDESFAHDPSIPIGARVLDLHPDGRIASELFEA
jgi:3',5'-cyclic-AMP phosphodiesterase